MFMTSWNELNVIAVVITPDYSGWALSVSLWISSVIFMSDGRCFPTANLWLYSFTTCSFLHFSLQLTVYPPAAWSPAITQSFPPVTKRFRLSYFPELRPLRDMQPNLISFKAGIWGEGDACVMNTSLICEINPLRSHHWKCSASW